jgi:hypothetical protein
MARIAFGGLTPMAVGTADFTLGYLGDQALHLYVRGDFANVKKLWATLNKMVKV